MKRLCAKNNCELVIVPHNLTNKFQPLDISINQSAKKFISNKFNAWYADRVSKQLSNGVAPGDVKVSLKLGDLKPLHPQWIVEIYNHLKHQNDSIVKSFDTAGIRERDYHMSKQFLHGSRKSFRWAETTTEFLIVFLLFFHKNITLFDLLDQLTFLLFCHIFLPLSLFLTTDTALRVLTT